MQSAGNLKKFYSSLEGMVGKIKIYEDLIKNSKILEEHENK